MSKIVYCAKSYCFSKQLVDQEDDVLKLGWSKNTCNSCGNIKYVCNNCEAES